jgi:hypothetical protein
MNQKELKALCDEYVTVEAQRKAASKTASDLEKVRDNLKKVILANMSFLGQDKPNNVKGTNYVVAVKQKLKIVASDWDKLYKYIAANSAWDLLHKRITETAVKARWEDKETVPGIEGIPTDDLEIIT